MKIILASASPRRRELLRVLGLEVTAIAPSVDEIEESELLSPQKIAEKNAELKCDYIFKTYGMFGADFILGADTIVVLDGHVLGKPKNVEHAVKMLSQLSGREHEVITSYCLVRGEKKQIRSVTSKVFFRKLSESEINAYVMTKECMDKAGAYGVQGAGAALVKKVEGSISNVVGLPIEELLADARLSESKK